MIIDVSRRGRFGRIPLLVLAFGLGTGISACSREGFLSQGASAPAAVPEPRSATVTPAAAGVEAGTQAEVPVVTGSLPVVIGTTLPPYPTAAPTQILNPTPTPIPTLTPCERLSSNAAYAYVDAGSQEQAEALCLTTKNAPEGDLCARPGYGCREISRSLGFAIMTEANRYRCVLSINCK